MECKEPIGVQEHRWWSYPNIPILPWICHRVQHCKSKATNIRVPDTAISAAISAASHIITVDAGCFTSGNTSWGLVIQDHHLCASFASCRREEIVADPLVTEALGLRWAILTAKERNVQRPCFRTDAAVIMDCIHQKTTRSSIELIIQDCRHLLLDFDSPIVTHIKRIEMA